MQIQINTDHNIDHTEELTERVEDEVRSGLRHHIDRLTRVEVTFADENAAKTGSGNDKRCVLEARPAGHQPVAVTEHADTAEAAVRSAARKMDRLLQNTFGKDRR